MMLCQEFARPYVILMNHGVHSFLGVRIWFCSSNFSTKSQQNVPAAIIYIIFSTGVEIAIIERVMICESIEICVAHLPWAVARVM